MQFPVTGPLRYTMTAHDAIELVGLVKPRTAIPIHYEGWKHFKEGRDAIERELAPRPPTSATASAGCRSVSPPPAGYDRRVMRTLLISVLVFGVLAGSAQAQTVGYRGNPTHDSRVAGVPAPPLGVLWQADLGSPMGYPVVAEGAVFVSVRNKTGTGTTIVSLDAATGAVRWSVPNPGVYWYGGLAYDAGRLYVVNHDGDLRALAPASGAVLWAVKLAQYSYDSPPVAYDGKVYIVGTGSGATLSVVDGASGAVLWTRNMPSGGGSPAVDAERIYVGMACRWMYAYGRVSGDLLWQHQSDCSGGGDYTPAVSAGRVYAQGDNPAVYDAASGTQVATATFDGAYGIADGMAYVPLKGALLGVDAASWATRWTYGGTGVSSEAPLIGDTHVYVTGDAGVLALDRATGAPAWCAGSWPRRRATITTTRTWVRATGACSSRWEGSSSRTVAAVALRSRAPTGASAHPRRARC